MDGLFREVLESQKKDNAPLLHLVHSDDPKYFQIFGRFFNLFFQGFVLWVSFIDCEGSTPWVISDAPIAKVGWRFHGQMLINSWYTRSLVDRLWPGHQLSFASFLSTNLLMNLQILVRFLMLSNLYTY
jgi:hypothetical protein